MQLATQHDLEVCGEAEDVAGALALLATTGPDVAIVDISLKAGNGLDLIRRIKEREEAVRIILDEAVSKAIQAEAHDQGQAGSEADRRCAEILKLIAERL